MNLDNDNVIGIVGGMGPESGISLCNRIMSHTSATRDQEHLSVMLMSLPGILSDRTAFLEGQTILNPAYNIAAIIRKLEYAGAGIIGIACNTAHSPAIFDVILQDLQTHQSKVRLLHMPSETCRYLREKHFHARRIGIMTTNGGYKTALYANLLKSIGYDVLLPDRNFQETVIHRMIYDPAFGVKATAGNISREARILMDCSLDFFREQNAEAIVMGCTELSLLAPDSTAETNMAIIDCLEAFALALIREATPSKTDRVIPVEI